ncbi:hypothetical protein PPERSA_10993 [Pseudocohnilembus persalinus]|uniref:RanBP2-type domain-containing protein n=1 Tax=Pseudocohnilembus persalinus TaxID=266149 RepID=A0A0V0QCG3_PSEPJ|nr:hypothetical protein PPERSA_10993 [Pseudocohnilembus persalinus]|eukprot:KRW99874.1 hypothetical protein PPERSA_10993 [Pseudocohnilembus persalinus]
MENLVSCTVCLEIKKESKGCNQCNVVVCDKCIEDLRQINNFQCPKCRKQDWISNNLVLQNMIEIYLQQQQQLKETKKASCDKKCQNKNKDQKIVPIQKRDFWICEECGLKNKIEEKECLGCGEENEQLQEQQYQIQQKQQENEEQKEEQQKNQEGKEQPILEKYIQLKNGDWKCTNCDSNNKKTRWSCYKCEMKKEKDWICPKCNANNYCVRWSCHECDERRNNDWNCEECDTLNWGTRNTCRKCLCRK